MTRRGISRGATTHHPEPPPTTRGLSGPVPCFANPQLLVVLKELKIHHQSPHWSLPLSTPTTYHPLLTTHHPLLTTHHPLLTTHHSLHSPTTVGSLATTLHHLWYQNYSPLLPSTRPPSTWPHNHPNPQTIPFASPLPLGGSDYSDLNLMEWIWLTWVLKLYVIHSI